MMPMTACVIRSPGNTPPTPLRTLSSVMKSNMVMTNSATRNAANTTVHSPRQAMKGSVAKITTYSASRATCSRSSGRISGRATRRPRHSWNQRVSKAPTTPSAASSQSAIRMVLLLFNRSVIGQQPSDDGCSDPHANPDPCVVGRQRNRMHGGLQRSRQSDRDGSNAQARGDAAPLQATTVGRHDESQFDDSVPLDECTIRGEMLRCDQGTVVA